MKMFFKLITMLLTVSILFACSNENEPQSDEFVSAFEKNLPEKISVNDFKIELSENIGTKVEPVIRSRIKVNLKLIESRYEKIGLISNKAILEELMKEGETVEVFGFANSKLIADKWAISFDKININPQIIGKIKSSWEVDGYVLSGSNEEKQLLKELKERYKKLGMNTPDGAMKAVVTSLRSNDLKIMFKYALTEEQYSELVAEFEKGKGTEISEADDMQFKQMMGMLTSEGAEDTLYAMAAPQLEQARAMLPMMLMMGKEQALQTIKTNPMVPEDQRDNAAKMAGAMIDWVGENDILSEEVTKGAIAAAVATAKELNMSSLSEVKNMSFDQALEKGTVVLGGVKNIMGAYGISMDDMLDSVELSNVQVNGETATMDMTMKLFGEEITQAVNMVQKNGKWVSDK